MIGFNIFLCLCAVAIVLCVIIRVINDEQEKYNKHNDDSTETYMKHLFGDDDV